MSSSRSWRGLWPWLLLFVLAAGLRSAVLVRYEADYVLADSPLIDERSYDRWAQEIAAGDWLGQEVFFQEPLYPYFMGTVYALAGHTPPARGALRRVQVLLGALTAVLVAGVGARAFGRGAGLASGFLVALHGPALILPAWLLKPNLFLPLLAALCLLLLRSAAPGAERRALWLWAGVLAGLGALLRGNMLLLLPWLALLPLLLTGWRQPRRWLPQTAALLLGVALILVPVALRNRAVGGVFALTTSGAGTNVYGGNNLDNPYGRATEFDWVRGIPEYEAGDWRREAERRTGRTLDAGEVSRFWLAETWRSMRLNPGAHLRILWNKLRLTLSGYEVPDNHSYDWDRSRLGWLGAWPFDWRLTGSLGLAGMLLWLLGPGRSRAGWLLLALFLLYLGTIVATVTSDRVRLALLVPLAPFAGWILAELPKRWQAGAAQRWRYALSLGLGALPVLWLPLDAGQRLEDWHKRDYNLAVHLLATPDGLSAAHAIVRDLVERYPTSSRLATMLSEVEALQGFKRLRATDADERAQAQDQISAALKRLGAVANRPETNPRERFRARSLAGWIQLELGRGDAAMRHFRAAMEFDHESADVRRGMAEALELAAEQSADGAQAAAWRAEAAALRAGLALGAG
jgi:4-amino-4-deoxy-L-arabinose transferase-like glycosyltransferase